ncbi:MAG: flagellar hook-basal body complex protein, partial [Candidatus Adiutrix sp.]|nr:flagellar hook-basal body complex protein [Candidatus Adiutrix sp.]
MALSSSMYAAVTGLSALGTGMQTISNNIANVNTVGFKAMRTNYEDLISQNYFSGGKTNQKGTGVRISTIQSMFTQGAFMSSAQDTDMAIAGEGFFSVRNAITGAINYTRAGVFTLSKDGYMEDPNGNILQGWKLAIPKPGQPAVKIGAPTDIKIVVTNAPPAATTEVKMVTNLDADAEPVYEYKEHQLSEDYADEIAIGYAEKARDAAIFNIWNDFCTPIEFASGIVTSSFTSPPQIVTASAYPREFDATQPAVIIPAAGALGLNAGDAYSAKVWFTKTVWFHGPDGKENSGSVAYSAVITFAVSSNVYTVSAGTLRTSASPVGTAGPGVYAANWPLSAMTVHVSGIPYTYTTGKMANVEQTKFYLGSSAFTTDMGITVPAGTSGSPYLHTVFFTDQVTFPHPFIVGSSVTRTYITSTVISLPMMSSKSYVYTTPVNYFELCSASVPFASAYNFATTASGHPVQFYPTNISAITVTSQFFPTAAGMPVTVTLETTTPVRDAYGKLYASAVSIDVDVYFNWNAISGALAGTPLTVADLSNPVYVDYFVAQGFNNGAASAVTVTGCLKNFTAPLDVDFQANGIYNKVGTTFMGHTFSYQPGVQVPAANGVTTHAGDFYYQD